MPPSSLGHGRTRLMMTLAVLGGASTVALFACVDLFHSTDFPTLCSTNPSACESETGSDAPIGSEDGGELGDGGGIDIDFCKLDPRQARQSAEHACAWLGACQGVLEESKLGECMLHALAAYDCTYNPTLRPNGDARATWGCLANVKTCAETQACVYGAVPVPQCQAIDAGTFTSCAAERLVVECGPGQDQHPPSAIESCVLEGHSCHVVDLSLAICAGASGHLCTGAPRCDKTNAVQCRNTIDVGVDCASFGSGKCVEHDGGVACAPIEDAGACGASQSATALCDDAGVVHSCVDGKDVRVNCASIGMPCTNPEIALDPTQACANKNAGGGACVAFDECAGAIAKSCGRGKLFEVDCKKQGLGTCVKNAGSIFATCSVPDGGAP